MIDEDEFKVSAEIGCPPPISQPLREFIRCLMNTAPHEFVTVDMRGLKTALVAHARGRQVSVSVVVREALASVLPAAGDLDDRTSEPASSQVKLSIRFDADNVVRLDRAAKAAGLSRGVFLSGLVEGVPAVSSGGRTDCISALIASNAELSTMSRNLRHLASLLARSEMHSAQRYRSLLDEVAGEVHRHLGLSGQALKQLQPQATFVGGRDHNAKRKEIM